MYFLSILVDMTYLSVSFLIKILQVCYSIVWKILITFYVKYTDKGLYLFVRPPGGN